MDRPWLFLVAPLFTAGVRSSCTYPSLARSFQEVFVVFSSRRRPVYDHWSGLPPTLESIRKTGVVGTDGVHMNTTDMKVGGGIVLSKGDRE